MSRSEVISASELEVRTTHSLHRPQRMELNNSVVLHLPAAIRDMIFYHLSDDRHVLGICGLTCRAWYSITRVYLFHSVHILGSVRYEEFEWLLLRAPHIARYVRDLSITMDGTFSWLDQEAPRVLLKLDKVERLKLRNWSATIMSDETRRSLQRFFPRVRTLVLQDTAFAGNDLPLLLSACPRLSVLHMYDVFWSYRNRALVTVVANSRNRIHSLSLRRTSALASAWLTNGVFEMRLRKLEAWWEEPAQALHVRYLLQEAGESLEHVVLAPSLRETRSEDPITDQSLLGIGLSNNTKLMTLRMIVETWRSDSQLWVPNVLEQLCSSRIRCIEIVLLLRQADALPELDWDRIDQHLTRQAVAHPSVKVLLDVHAPLRSPAGGVSAEDVRDAIMSRLPKSVVEMHHLQVVCTHTDDIVVSSAWPCGHRLIGEQDTGQDTGHDTGHDVTQNTGASPG